MQHVLCSLVDSYKVRMITTYPKSPNSHKSCLLHTSIHIRLTIGKNPVCGAIGQYVGGDSHSVEYYLAAQNITDI